MAFSIGWNSAGLDRLCRSSLNTYSWLMSENQIGNTAVLIQNSSDLLAELRDKTRMTAAMAVLSEEQNRGVVLASFPGTGDHAYVPRIGYHFHLHPTAPGKAILAALPELQQNDLLARMNFRKFTDKTCRDASAFKKDLAQGTEQGYAVDVGEYAEGINCLGTSICDQDGQPLAAIWITAHSLDLPVDAFPALANDLKRVAREIGERLARNNPDTSTYVTETLKQAKQFMDENFANEEAIYEFVQDLNMSESWFRTCFRKTYGISPMQYRQKLLYDKARSLLEHTQLSIKEIAFQLGFDTQNYFSRAFKNQQGVSPAQFRSQVQEASSEESSE